MKKKNIIIFSGYYLPFLGGIERYTNKLSKELIKQNCTVTIVCSNNDNLRDYERIDGVDIYRIPIIKFAKNRYPIYKRNKKFKEIWNMVISKKYDHIICNTRFQLTTLLGIKLSKKENIPIYVIDHGSSHFTVNNVALDILGERYEHFLTNIVKKDVKYFYGVSNRCIEWLKHFKIQGTGVIYNSIDDSNWDKYKNEHLIDKNNEIVICYAGRLIKEKGLYELCEAYKKIRRKYKNTKLYIAGDGPILEDLKEKYSDNIEFLGKLNFDDVMALYNDSDIFVHPSMYAEGLPTSILEAGLMKNAIIATDRGGTTEVISESKYGLIMEENTQSLVESLEKLLDNPKIIEEYKNNIHNRVKKYFSWKSTTERLLMEMEINNER